MKGNVWANAQKRTRVERAQMRANTHMHASAKQKAFEENLIARGKQIPAILGPKKTCPKEKTLKDMQERHALFYHECLNVCKGKAAGIAIDTISIERHERQKKSKENPCCATAT